MLTGRSRNPRCGGCATANTGAVRVSTKTTRLEDARRFLKLREGAIARHEYIQPKADRVTFLDMATALRRDYELNGKHLPTLKARLGHLEHAFGTRRMASLTPDDIERYKDQRRSAGATNGTINRELEVLARAFRLGRKLGKLSGGVAVRDHRLAEAVPRQGFFEADQYEAVRRRLPADLQVATAIEYVFGWRVQSEVLALERRHVDLEANTIRLDPGMAKNDEARVVYLTPDLAALVSQQLARVATLERQMGRVIPYLFPHLSGQHRGARIQDFRRAWRTACRRAGAPGMLRHDFRRTAVRNLVNAGVVERVAMQITGHKTRPVFDRYHIVSPADLQEASRKLAAVAAGKVSSKVGQ